MAKKSSSRKSLKSLFSRSEASLDKSAEKDADKNVGEKKRFKFLKFKMKTKGGSASDKSTNENQQVLSAAEPNNTAEDGDVWAENIVSDKKRSSLYATAPRSQGNKFSYSELDLRKPKRFATFSLGLRKKKRKDDENISRTSTFGLHSLVIEAQDENPLDLSPMELDQANTRTMFSMSQPELDTSDTFDIPSPPPVATNQAESNFPLFSQSQSSVTINTQAQGAPTNGSDLLDVHQETRKAPIATIPELQLGDLGLSEEKENIPVHDNSSKSDSNSSAPMTRTETISAVDTQTAPSVPASQPAVMLDTSDHLDHHHRAAVVDSVCASKSLCDNYVPQQSNTKTEISLTESASERSIPETARSITTTSAVSGEKRAPPVNQDAVYGALYDSLFPESFASEITSSLSTPSSQIRTEIIRRVNVKSEPVMVKSLNEYHTETNVIYSCPSSSHDSAARRMDDAVGSYTNINFSERKVISSSEGSSVVNVSTRDAFNAPYQPLYHQRFNSYQSPAASEPQIDPDVHRRYLPSSVNSHSEPVGQDTDKIPYSELTRSHSGMNSDSPSLVEDTVGSVAQNSATPISHCVTSQGKDTQVTDSKRRVILVKELVTNGTRVDSGCPSLVPDKMTAVTDLEMKVETTEKENFSAPSGLMEGCEVPCSLAYLSVGSDDGSAMEVYYSAEEDNAEESGGEEMYTVDEREETCLVDGLKDAEELPQQEEITERGISRSEGRSSSAGNWYV